MYIVSIQNGSTVVEIQNEHHKLFSGNVVQGINAIDSFTFSILPDNPAFGALSDFVTLVNVYNTARQRYEFQGRVLYTSPQMSDKGLITQEAVCESYLGFLCDSRQVYMPAQKWTVTGLLGHIILIHNSQLEEYKHFRLGVVNVTGSLDVGIQRESTWETIKKKLLDVLGGEIQFRQVDGVLYLDYVEQLGELKSTEIALSKNMKSIVKEKDPSAFITRLIPLGAKIKVTEKDAAGNDVEVETEQRVDITSVNGGRNYIDDTEAIAVYGLHVGVEEFDGETDPEAEGYVEDEDVSKPSVVLRKGREWLKANNKVSIKYSITALDLSLIGLDADDFTVHNTYPLKNSLLGIDDTGRVNKKNIDVCDDTKTSFEIGESFKSLSELQREQMVSLGTVIETVGQIHRNYVPNQKLVSLTRQLTSLIEQTEDRITLEVDGKFATKDDLKGYSTTAEMNTAIEQKVSDSEAYITQQVEGKYATKDDLDDYAKTATLTSTIKQVVKESGAEITLAVGGAYASRSEFDGFVEETEASLDVAVKRDPETGKLVGQVTVDADQFKVESDNFSLDKGQLEIKDSDGATVSIGEVLQGVAIKSQGFKDHVNGVGGSGLATMYHQNGVALYHAPTGTTLAPIQMLVLTVDGNLTTSYALDGEWKIYREGSLSPITSDRNRKNTIEAQGEVYSRIFDRLRPVTFKYNNGESDRLHTGLIAQDVEEAVLAEGLTTKDFAAVCYDVDENGKKTNYAIRYGELVSMCIKEIQDLKAEVARLKQANNVTP